MNAREALPIVDPHQHFWDLERNPHPWLNGDHAVAFRYGDYSALKRNYLPEDYRRDTANQNVVASVHVEAEWDPSDPVAETRWLHEIAARTGFPHAIVGQAWFAREDIEAVLAGHAGYPLVRAVRQKPAAAASPDEVIAGAPGSMGDPVWRSGYGLLEKFGLHYELQTRYWHLVEGAALARDFPDIAIVLNHAGVPEDRSPRGLAAWREGMEAMAAEPNVSVKISGIGQKDRPWTVDGNRDVVLQVIEMFGVERCMFASNFPVDSLVAGYDTIFDGFKAITSEFSDADRRKLFHDNAVRIYRLS